MNILDCKTIEDVEEICDNVEYRCDTCLFSKKFCPSLANNYSPYNAKELAERKLQEINRLNRKKKLKKLLDK